jgi:signal transduction histidine kinase
MDRLDAADRGATELRDAPEPGSASADAPATPPAHVLVVDDKQAVRSYLNDLFLLQGWRVTQASNGEEALAACRVEVPHVVLTDLAMEPVNGRDLISALRRLHPNVVAVVFTGFGTLERAVDLMRIGAFDVLTKPCTATEITATVEKALEHHQALRANDDLRERLRVQEKLAMIGKLAAGVAHELNNPLDAVLRCVRLTRRCVEAGRGAEASEAREYLGIAEQGLQRMADIVQGLLTFSRHAAAEQTPQSLVALLEEAATAVRLALGDAAPTLRVEVRPDVANAPVPRAVHQIVVNLLRNAVDAAGREHPVSIRAHREEDRLLIQVQDRGPGIPADVLPRIFEPFFTTKQPGRGTGLGLPISARLAERFGGSVSLECPSGGGTVATVTLPSPRPASVPIPTGGLSCRPAS